MQVTAEVLVERRREGAVCGEPPELHVSAYCEQYIAECVRQAFAHCALQLRHLAWICGWHDDERANVGRFRGQDVLHFAEPGQDVHAFSFVLARVTRQRDEPSRTVPGSVASWAMLRLRIGA